MKLYRKHELEAINYVELYPGRLRKGYMNQASIYITDNDFSLIVSAVKRGFEQYEPYNSFEIGKRQWELILYEVEKITKMINQFKDISELDEYISILYKEDNLRRAKIEETIMNRESIVSFTEDLAKWINKQFETIEYITLIGN